MSRHTPTPKPKLTAFEKRLRRVLRIKAFGHNPFAPNCMWSEQDFLQPEERCKSCEKLRFRHTPLRRVKGAT